MTRRAIWLLLIAVALIPFVLVARNAHERALHELQVRPTAAWNIRTEDVEDILALSWTKFRFVPYDFNNPIDPRLCPWGKQEQGCVIKT